MEPFESADQDALTNARTRSKVRYNRRVTHTTSPPRETKDCSIESRWPGGNATGKLDTTAVHASTCSRLISSAQGAANEERWRGSNHDKRTLDQIQVEITEHFVRWMDET